MSPEFSRIEGENSIIATDYRHFLDRFYYQIDRYSIHFNSFISYIAPPIGVQDRSDIAISINSTYIKFEFNVISMEEN